MEGLQAWNPRCGTARPQQPFLKIKLCRDFNNSNKACARCGQHGVRAVGRASRGVDDTGTDCVVRVQRLGIGRSCARGGRSSEICPQFAHRGMHRPSCDWW
jgi:hypothetical protein